MFKNQHVLITGGSSGLGLEIAYLLAAAGAKLTLLARNVNKLNEARTSILQRSPQAMLQIKAVDVSDETAVLSAMTELSAEFGGLDMLVNSAGILREGYFDQLQMRDFREVMEVNYFGLLNVVRAAQPHLQKSQGRLVNIASMAGMTGAFGYSSYSASKHALVGLSECLRYEFKPLGINVHLVCPGEFDSPMVDALDAYRTPENKAHTLIIPKMSVEDIAQSTLSGIKANKFLIIPGARTRAAAFGIQHFPAISRTMGDRMIAKVQKQLSNKAE